MTISARDKDILRELASKVAVIGGLPVQTEKAELWRRLNQLEPVRPLVWFNDICWYELNVDDELTLQTADEWAREQEQQLRQTIYWWKHMPGDMVVDDYLSCPLVIRSSGLGIDEKVDIARTDEKSGIVSRHFHRQIFEPEDIDKIKMPKVTYDEAATEANYQRMCEVFGQIMPVSKVGQKIGGFAPWDELIRWWGVEEALMDLIARPEMVTAIVSHLVDAYLCDLDQLEELNLLSPNNDNIRIASGGYGYTDELPGEDFEPEHVRTRNMWGGATAQIFSEVSPEMHWEFALKHELRWLERWGLTYYGCCEPLDGKMALMRRIPNLRKISMSPWINVDRAVAEVGADYVFSYKPNPAILAEDKWQPARARDELGRVLERAQQCRVEVIMKDISTVRYEPQRLWDWEKMAMELAEEFGC